jgi:uncharacterized membrane protein YccC
MLAFAIALRLDMPRPYWAMASVYITSTQLTGATWSKAVYRMLGTLIGAAGVIALIPNLVDAPELLSFAIALWVGICLYLSLIDGTPRSYLFMLSGYTVALLGFPVLSMPELTFDIVVARVQEIMLGIICASVVSMLVLPRSVVSAIAAQADVWLAGARRLGVDVLTARGSDRERDNERMRLAAAASEIDQLWRHLDYETATSANTARGLRRLRQHMLSLLPLLASIEDRRIALNSHEGTPANIAAISASAARWLADGGRDGPEADGLRAALNEVQPQLGADANWNEIMVAGFVIRLRNLMDITRDCQLLRAAIADGRDPDLLPLAFTSDTLTPAVPHRDHGLALWTAAATALSVLACCAFWIATGWPDGATAPIFAAVLGSLLAGVDDPLPAFRGYYGVFLAVIAVNGIYTFGVLPRVTTLEMLIVALMPAFLLFGCSAVRLFGWLAARLATARLGAQQLENPGCGCRRQDAARSRRDCQSHAASSGPACRADHRGSRRGTEQRRQSSSASSSLESRRSQAGEPCPVTTHKSGDRRFPCSPCFGLPDPPRRPASGPTGRTARQHDRIDIARAGERGAQ